MMPIMSKFFFYCSVRLGSIIAGAISIFQAIIPLCILLANGADNLRENALYMRSHINEYHREVHFEMLITYLEKDSETFCLIAMVLLSIYILICFIEIFASYKLYKWLLLPYIMLELSRLIFLLALHVIGMIVLKKKLNLGALIGITVAGGFGLLLLFYIWACVVAFFQIIVIVNEQNYKHLYGNDPLAPWTEQQIPLPPTASTMAPTTASVKQFEPFTKTNNKSVIVENVQLYPTPDFSHASPPQKNYNNNNVTKLRNLNNYFEKQQNMKNGYDHLQNTDMLNRDFSALQNRLANTYKNVQNRIRGYY